MINHNTETAIGFGYMVTISVRFRNGRSLRAILSSELHKVGLYFSIRFTFPKGTLAHGNLLRAFFLSAILNAPAVNK